MNEHQSKMMSTNDYDSGLHPRMTPPVASVSTDQVTETRILEMNLLIRDVHTAVNSMRTEGARPLSASSASRSRPQSANGSSAGTGNSPSDKTQGLVLRDIRGLIHRTQSIGTMLLEVLSSLNDVRAASMLQAKLLEHGLQPRNMNMTSEVASPSPQSTVNDGGQMPENRGPVNPNSRPLSASSYAGSHRTSSQVPQNMRPVSWAGFPSPRQMPQAAPQPPIAAANRNFAGGFQGPPQQNLFPESYQPPNFNFPDRSFQDPGPAPMSWEGYSQGAETYSENFQAQGPYGVQQSNPYGNMEMPLWSGSAVGHPGVFQGQNLQPQYPPNVRQPQDTSMMDPTCLMDPNRTLDPFAFERQPQQQRGQEAEQNPDEGEQPFGNTINTDLGIPGMEQQPQMDENTESAGDTTNPAIPGMMYDPDSIEELQ